MTQLPPLLGRVDSVYFLLIPGWETELRANRWHFAVRWAKRKPVVLVNPVLRHGAATSIPEERIPNCRVLRVQAASEPNVLAKVDIQIQQVQEDMAQHGLARPLLWCYNPDLVDLYARVPAMARLHHASEAFFDMPGRSASTLIGLRGVLATSDLTVAVSEGVASSLRRRAPDAQIETVTNGCDYTLYSSGRPDADLKTAARKFERTAVYAGNINSRVDFSLLELLTDAYPRFLFALYGPVKELSRDAAQSWRRVSARPNVIAQGAVDPDRLPDLYAAADVGIIPYLHDPFLVENGFPLKALEMCATGLPVVSSLMKPLLGVADGLKVTSSVAEFVEAVGATSRSSLSPATLAGLKAVSAANDYDAKFEAIVTLLDHAVARTEPEKAVDRLASALGPEWSEAQSRYARWRAMPAPLRAAGRLAGSVALLLPARVRRWIARGRLRTMVRLWLGS